jgi:hypothetical protein
MEVCRMGDYKLKSIILTSALSLSFVAAFVASAPATAKSGTAGPMEIHNKQLRLKIYPPDTQNGFYKGVRFDWSGVIADLEFAGHHLYRPWFASVDASVPDFIYADGGIVAGTNSAMTGPVEEFQKPVGYEDAAPGGTFLKVGVGLLRKMDNAPYRFTTHFPLVDGGKWSVRKSARSVAFEQVLGGANADFGYDYTKTIRLVGNSAALMIEHHLKNTGRLPITTNVYDHNFLTIDGMDVGKAYSISAPYDIHPRRAPNPNFVSIDGKKASYIVDLQGKDSAAFGLQGFSADPKDYDFAITNRAASVEVRIKGDRPLTNVEVWSIRSVLALEPFIDIDVAPGQDYEWSYTYTYSAL